MVSHNATQPPVCISLPEGKWDANEGLGEGRARKGGGEIKWEIGRGGMLSTAARRVPEGDQEKRKEDKKQGGSGRAFHPLKPPHPLKLLHLLNLMCL